MNLKKDIRVGVGVASAVMALLSPLVGGMMVGAGEEAAATSVAVNGGGGGGGGSLSRVATAVAREGEDLARTTTTSTESLVARHTEEGLARQTSGTGLKRTREDLEGGVRRRTRKEAMLALQTPLGMAERSQLLRTMPDELKKLHGELRRIAPGHLDDIPLCYMTEQDWEDFSAMYRQDEIDLHGSYLYHQRIILLNKSSSMDLRSVVYHESAHVIEADLGTMTPGLMHNDAFQQIHSTVWARAYGQEILSREELDAGVASMNSFAMKLLDQDMSDIPMTKLELHLTNKKNHFLDVAGIIEKTGVSDDDVLLKDLLRNWPFPKRRGYGYGYGYGGGGGGGGL